MAASIKILLNSTTTELILSEIQKNSSNVAWVWERIVDNNLNDQTEEQSKLEKLKWAIIKLYSVRLEKVISSSAAGNTCLIFNGAKDVAIFVECIVKTIDDELGTPNLDPLIIDGLESQKKIFTQLKENRVALTPSTTPLPSLSSSPASSSSASPVPNSLTPSYYPSSSASPAPSTASQPSYRASVPPIPTTPPPPLPKTSQSTPCYRVVMSKQAVQKAGQYLASLKATQVNPGTRLAAVLIANQIDLRQLTLTAFIDLLLETKIPYICAEEKVLQAAINAVAEWTEQEASILGDINIAMEVTVYDNGNHTAPRYHTPPLTASLLYTPGALLHASPPPSWAIAPNPDYAEIIPNGKFDRDKFKALYTRRLLPLLIYANEKAKSVGKLGFIAVPGIGCGQFAGGFANEVQTLFPLILHELVWENRDKLTHIAAVYCTVDSKRFYEVQHITNSLALIFDRPYVRLDKWGQSLDGGIPPRDLLEEPRSHGEQYANCWLFKVVAWDHFSWPGNDFYHNYNRKTDDGVSAAATDTISRLTGIPGNYQIILSENYRNGAYYPYSWSRTSPGLSDWETLIKQNKLKLRTGGQVVVYDTVTGQLIDPSLAASASEAPPLFAPFVHPMPQEFMPPLFTPEHQQLPIYPQQPQVQQLVQPRPVSTSQTQGQPFAQPTPVFTPQTQVPYSPTPAYPQQPQVQQFVQPTPVFPPQPHQQFWPQQPQQQISELLPEGYEPPAPPQIYSQQQWAHPNSVPSSWGPNSPAFYAAPTQSSVSGPQWEGHYNPAAA